MRNPIGTALGVPADLTAGLRVLPEIARHTRKMSDQLARMIKEIGKLGEDTGAIRDLDKQMAEVARVTAKMDTRMATIEGAMPTLVEVQQHLAIVPETLGTLDSQMKRLSETLEQLLVSLASLSESVEGLQKSVGPLSRIARRLPGGNRDEKNEVAQDG